ncbi:helix-turn-helix transcriptional regulator [Paenarthrobacter sp. NPDC018779]|uniref:helix-turn-helix transcriptional regulator n=1 Tax=Paenarthrobacter sp. NPDC018779 TaxID=3364375 RepID=UPI0037C58D1B
MIDAETIGRAIRDARKQAALNQLDLAELAGVAERTVRAVETGKGNPGLGAVIAIANVLGLHVMVG